jgi:hypothetical protein
VGCQKYNFTINQGSTKVLTITYTDSNNVPRSLVGYNVRMHLKSDPKNLNPDLELHSGETTDNKSTILIEPELGIITIYISALDTSLLINSVYFYDIEIYTDSDPYAVHDPEFVNRILEGLITTKYNITK